MLPPTSQQRQNTTAVAPANVLMLEPHFSYGQIAEFWGMSEAYIYELFRDEPGLMLTKGKRQTARVPRSVMERVYASMSQGVAR